MSFDLLRSLLSWPEVRTVRDLARARSMSVVLVGGAVRDALLGHPSPRDLDFAVQGDAIALGRAVADALSAAFYVLDAERGTTRVLLPDHAESAAGTQRSSPLIMDFAACRGPSWRADAFARDFTINAIAMSLEDGALIDETDGLTDLSAGVIRATNDRAMDDDPVRALRAVRLAFGLNMRIEPATLVMARSAGAALGRPSAERLRDELMAILKLDQAAHAARMLDDLGLLAPLVPEVEAMRSCDQPEPHCFTVLQHTWEVMAALDALLRDWRIAVGEAHYALKHAPQLTEHFGTITVEGRTRAAVYRFAALLHDCGKPATRRVGADGRAHFHGHEVVGAELAAARARALRLSSDEVARAGIVVRNHTQANFMARRLQQITPRALYRFFRDAGDCAPELAVFAVADCLGKRGLHTSADDCAWSMAAAQRLLNEYYTRFERSVAPLPLITGRDVIALGARQGPSIGEVLEAVREAQMIGEIATRDEALALARRLLSSSAHR
jgi:putative nucleotidyltransferase with HDIG domain